MRKFARSSFQRTTLAEKLSRTKLKLEEKEEQARVTKNREEVLRSNSEKYDQMLDIIDLKNNSFYDSIHVS